ncbi:hypothetical protein [Cereibacter sphaeroides]|uniref:hypothetical protein n=1 Tax=Cereibacter sphaeroides TaxID=1063 RepID=UPI001F250C15|nr:hypothetical protein [Cereibacter sphaeroides]MCE6970533.1 hypothetical protein [Cereibacter sphaeroides]
MGLQKQSHFPFRWAVAVPVSSQDELPWPATSSAVPRWRPRKRHLFAGAAGAYLALGVILTVDLSAGGLLALPGRAPLRSEAPEADPRGAADPLAVEQVAVAQDMRFLMADPDREATVEAPRRGFAASPAFAAVPLLQGAAARTEPAVDAVAPPRPAALQRVASPAGARAEGSLPPLPAVLDRVAHAGPPGLLAQPAPSEASPWEVAPSSYVPGFAWPPRLAPATQAPILARLPAASMGRVEHRSAFVFPDAGRSAGPSVPAGLGARRMEAGSEVLILWPAEGDRDKGCKPAACLSAVPLALGVEIASAAPEATGSARRTGAFPTSGETIASLDRRSGSAVADAGTGPGDTAQGSGRGASASMGNAGRSATAERSPGRGASEATGNAGRGAKAQGSGRSASAATGNAGGAKAERSERGASAATGNAGRGAKAERSGRGASAATGSAGGGAKAERSGRGASGATGNAGGGAKAERSGRGASGATGNAGGGAKAERSGRGASGAAGNAGRGAGRDGSAGRGNSGGRGGAGKAGDGGDGGSGKGGSNGPGGGKGGNGGGKGGGNGGGKGGDK